MTTAADWDFRVQYLRGQAKRLRRKASELEDEAARLDDAADQAEQVREFCNE